MKLQSRDGVQIDAYRAGEGNARGLVLVQEIFGVNSHIRETADRFAEKGYDVIAPAIFDRVEKNVELDYSQESIQKGLELRSKLAIDSVLSDIQAAIDALKGKPVAVIGYCWGGTLAWQAACKLKGLSVSSSWYPGGIGQVRDLVAQVPAQVQFGNQDTSIPMSEVEEFRAAQPNVEVNIYDAGHGFGCDHRGSYNEAAYKAALASTLAFFDKHLG